MESGLDCSVFFVVVVVFWLCNRLRWGGSVMDHQYFLLLIQTYVLSNVRPELFIVYSSLFQSLCYFYFLQQTFILLFTLPYF